MKTVRCGASIYCGGPFILWKCAKSGKVDEAAKKASSQDPEEAEANERLGRERAKEEDPAVERDYHKPIETGD